ncbi:hypothetical protein [Methylomonas rosea]|uniref:Uncharacterized protein n=1 Tax=Methylomonas rosea TaxID=2952227 RepID=A0ABT1TU91_9GAMM|nr:hypothetical protein [Methylomonas sp. WSC-7]MCQ8117916.1 hypothetical protein [Methylomonas sp. WSC-7]
MNRKYHNLKMGGTHRERFINSPISQTTRIRISLSIAKRPAKLSRVLGRKARGVAIFAERFFRASQQEKIGKNHATAYACGAPNRPLHLAPIQQGVETSALA